MHTLLQLQLVGDQWVLYRILLAKNYMLPNRQGPCQGIGSTLASMRQPMKGAKTRNLGASEKQLLR